MTEAIIYDHVRTPRGRGKPDGSLHTASTLHLAATALKAIKDRNHLDPVDVDDVVMGCVDPVGEAGGDIARMGALAAGFGDTVPGVQINRFCASGLDSVEFRRRAGDERTARSDDRRRRRIDEPRRHRRVGRRMAGRSVARDPRLFHASGRFGRPHRDEIRLLARRRRRLRGRVAEARRGGLEGGPVQELDRAGPRRQRPALARARRAYAPWHGHAVARFAEAFVRAFPASKAASTRSPFRRIRMSSASSMFITPAIRRASSTAPPRCCWARARRARKRALSRARKSALSPTSAPSPRSC